MMSDTKADTGDLLELTVRIVSAQVRHNEVQHDALPGLIEAVFRTLSAIDAKPAPAAAATDKPPPAVPVKRSVFPDYIVCLEDGKRLKTLKGHLRAAFGLTPAQYRERWGLPPEYPMVAPAYAERRSAIAKQLGLGRKRGDRTTPTETTGATAPAPRGRRKANG